LKYCYVFDELIQHFHDRTIRGVEIFIHGTGKGCTSF
jgi:hypothetical protein